MLLMDSQVKLILIAAGVGAILTISGAWSTWVTQTLINVDKNTEVMRSQVDNNHAMLETILGNLKLERVHYVNVVN
jgi:hypothetical protein|tara:strand:- start:190 stop:417 length:228 start_codon:yes stop_codon:yes gene_type:complete